MSLTVVSSLMKSLSSLYKNNGTNVLFPSFVSLSRILLHLIASATERVRKCHNSPDGEGRFWIVCHKQIHEQNPWDGKMLQLRQFSGREEGTTSTTTSTRTAPGDFLALWWWWWTWSIKVDALFRVKGTKIFIQQTTRTTVKLSRIVLHF